MNRSRAFWPALVLIAAALLAMSAVPARAATSYTVYNARQHLVGGSRVVDITPNHKYALVVGANDDPGDRRLRAILLSTNDFVRSAIDLSVEPALTGLGLVDPVVSSVAVHPSAGYAIVTVREDDDTTIISGTEKPGGALFITLDQVGGTMAMARTTPLPLGIHPESIAIAPNGQYAVVANEDPGAGSAVAPVRAGTISLIDLRSTPAAATVRRTITPSVPSGVGTNTRHAADPQPTSVAISPDSARAFVTMQQNNAIAIVDVGAAHLSTTAITLSMPRQPGSAARMFPVGLAVLSTPDGGQYLLTANPGMIGERADSVSLLRVQAGPSLALLADSGGALAAVATSAGLPKAADGSVQPSMIAVGPVGGALKAFVTLKQSDAVAVFDLDPAGASKLQLEGLVPLNRAGQPPAYGPEGIALAHISDALDYIVTANAGRDSLISQNISLIVAQPSAAPAQYQVWLPLISR